MWWVKLTMRPHLVHKQTWNLELLSLCAAAVGAAADACLSAPEAAAAVDSAAATGLGSLSLSLLELHWDPRHQDLLHCSDATAGPPLQ